MPRMRALGDERGSSAVDFVLVGTLLTSLTLAVLQFGVAVYVRNTVHDAAVEGAHYAALADTTTTEGAARTRLMITRAIGPRFAEHITARTSHALGHPTIEVRVHTVLPIIGLWGFERSLEVSAHAPQESFDG